MKKLLVLILLLVLSACATTRAAELSGEDEAYLRGLKMLGQLACTPDKRVTCSVCIFTF